MLLNLRRAFLSLALAAAVVPGGASGQDIEMLGKIHGTRPPQGYFDLLERDPGAFQFKRALFRRGLGVQDLPPVEAPGQSVPARSGRAFAELLSARAERSPVTGTFNFPLILGQRQQLAIVLNRSLARRIWTHSFFR